MGKELFRAHQEWASRPPDERYQSVDALATAVQERRAASQEATVSQVAFQRVQATVDERGSLRIGGHAPTHWSFGQVAGLVRAPAGYLRDLPPELAAQCLNRGIAHRLEQRDSDFQLLVGANGTSVLRAVTSGRYARIWDAEVLAAVQQHAVGFSPPLGFKNGEWGQELVPSGLYASDHDVFCFLVKDDERVEVNGEELGRGFYAWNSETGGATFGFATFLYRYVCGNNIIWGADAVQQFRVRHTGRKAREAITDLFPRALEALRRNPGVDLEVIRQAQRTELAKTPETAAEVLQGMGFTRTEVTGAVASAQREERDPFTRWGLLNGLTGYARTLPHIDQRVDLEQRATKALLVA